MAKTFYYKGKSYPIMTIEEACEEREQQVAAGHDKHIIDTSFYGGSHGEYIVVDPPEKPED